MSIYLAEIFSSHELISRVICKVVLFGFAGVLGDAASQPSHSRSNLNGMVRDCMYSVIILVLSLLVLLLYSEVDPYHVKFLISTSLNFIQKHRNWLVRFARWPGTAGREKGFVDLWCRLHIRDTRRPQNPKQSWPLSTIHSLRLFHQRNDQIIKA